MCYSCLGHREGAHMCCTVQLAHQGFLVPMRPMRPMYPPPACGGLSERRVFAPERAFRKEVVLGKTCPHTPTPGKGCSDLSLGLVGVGPCPTLCGKRPLPPKGSVSYVHHMNPPTRPLPLLPLPWN